jgi:cobyrinic acid a,c-diamide synthase
VVYLGGGYPELYLPALASSPCTRDLKHAADGGIPLYAECGGLMYLTREIQAEKTFRMAGVLPAEAEMTGKIQALGYVKGSVISATSLLQQNTAVTGHEFHYSRIVADSDARYSIKLQRGKGIESGNDGMTVGNALGSYTHCYFSRSVAADIVRAGRIFSER